MRKTNRFNAGRKLIPLLAALMGLVWTMTVSADDNSYTSTASGKWEDATNWSVGAPSTSFGTNYITNAVAKIVTVDAFTVTNSPVSMTVSNLLVSSMDTSTNLNTLMLIGTGTNNPLRVLNAFNLNSGALVISNAALSVGGIDSGALNLDGVTTINLGALDMFTDNPDVFSVVSRLGQNFPASLNATNSTLHFTRLDIGDFQDATANLINCNSYAQVIYAGFAGTNNLVIDGGSYTSPNDVYLGMGGSVQMTITDSATVQMNNFHIGAAPGPFSSATMSSGTLMPVQFFIGELSGANGLLSISNGAVSTIYTYVGYNGNGTLNMSGGTFSMSDMFVAQNAGSMGSVTVSGGTLQIGGSSFGGLNLASGVGSSGAFTVSGGWLIDTNPFNTITVGKSGNATFNVSGGTVLADGFTLGVDPGTHGALTISGGSVFSTGPIFAGTNGGGTGSIAVLSGGSLYVTNSSGTNTINLSPASSLTLNGGMLVVDNLSLTNGGSFTNLGGTLQYTGSFDVESNGTVAAIGGALQTATNFVIGSTPGSSSTAVVADGGSLTVTNGSIGIGNDGSNGSGSGSLIVSNGVVSARNITAGGFANTNLSVINVSGSNGVVHVTASLDGASFSNSAVSITVTNRARITVDTNMFLASGTNSIAILRVTDGGTLTVTNVLGLGNDGTTTNGSGLGIATISNATVSVGIMNLGSTASGLGMLTLQSNAVLNLTSNLTVVSGSLSSTSLVSVTGGSIMAPNSTIAIGPNGAGRMTVNGGTVIANLIKLGGTLASGELHLISGFVKAAGLSSNFIVVDGGDLDGSGGSIVIGESHNAAMQINSGTTKAATMFVGFSPGFTGTLTQSGGIVNVFTNMVVGDCINGAVGNVTLTGGTMYVTNQAHTAVLNVRSGTFTLNAGATLVVDTLVVTNGCGQFVNQGGTLMQNNAPVLDPNLSAVGDGIPNGWKQQYGLDPFDGTLANADTDHDGQNNLNEYLAGTNPTNAASVFKILDAAISNQDVRVDWTTVGGHSYVLQTNGDLVNGLFHDLTPAIPVPGTGESATNYIHAHAATNSIRFYRVRLSP